MFVGGENEGFFNMIGSSGKSVKDFSDISSLLHGDDSEMVLFVQPDQEGLVVVVEDASGFGPISVKPCSLKVLVTLLEQEMVISHLFLLLGSEFTQLIVGSLEISLEGIEGLDSLGFKFSSLARRNFSTKWEFSRVTSDSDSS